MIYEIGEENNDNDHILTVEDIKKILGISKSKAYELVHGNYFPVIDIGRKYIIPKKPFFEWLNGDHDDNRQ